MVAFRHIALGLGNQALHIADIEAILLLPATDDGNLAISLNGDTQQTVIQLLEVDDPDVGAHVVERGPGFGLGTFSQQNHHKAAILLQATGEHVDITGLEQLQGDSPPGEYD